MSLEIVTGEAAAANVAAEPLFLILYGGPGQEKTTEVVKTFGKSAFFIQCEPGALKPILARGLPMPDHPKQVVQTWDDLVAAIAFAGQHRDRYRAVVIDTISTWSAHVYRDLEKKFKGWAIPVAMRNYLITLREGARQLGLHVIMIAHAMPPQFNEQGQLQAKGGPLLTPKSAQGLFVPLVDTMLRVDTISAGAESRRVFFTGGPTWPTGAGMPPADLQLWNVKNRDGCELACVPADLRAYLAGRQPPYVGL